MSGDLVDRVMDDAHNPHEARPLKLAVSTAKGELEWEPRTNLATSLEMTTTWCANCRTAAQPHSRKCLGYLLGLPRGVGRNLVNSLQGIWFVCPIFDRDCQLRSRTSARRSRLTTCIVSLTETARGNQKRGTSGATIVEFAVMTSLRL